MTAPTIPPGAATRYYTVPNRAIRGHGYHAVVMLDVVETLPDCFTCTYEVLFHPMYKHPPKKETLRFMAVADRAASRRLTKSQRHWWLRPADRNGMCIGTEPQGAPRPRR